MGVLAAHLATITQANPRSVNITTGRYVVVYCGAAGGASEAGPPTVTVTGTGLTLTKIVERAPGVAQQCMVSAYGGFATATGTVTVNVSFAAAPAAGWSLVEDHAGIDTASPFVGAIAGPPAVGAAMALTLATPPVVGDTVRGVFCSRNKTSAATLGAGFAAVSNYGQTPAPTISALVEGRTGTTSTTVDASGLHTTNSSTGVAFILRAATGAPPAADEMYAYDGTSLATSPRVDPYWWDGSTLQPLDPLAI